MSDANKDLDRLLRSAGRVNEDLPSAPPFGFETRVVALWRAGVNPPNGVSGLIRRVALLSAVVMVVSTAAAVRELQQDREFGDSMTDDYAIADSVIQKEFSK